MDTNTKHNFIKYGGLITISIVVFIALLFFAKNSSPPIEPGINVLFIGNSFTYENDLPKTTMELAKSLGDRLEVDSVASGGLKIADHLQNPSTIAKIKSKKWDYIVLQEQSQLPSFTDNQFNNEVAPSWSALVNLIRQANPDTKIIFYETWGYRTGDAMNCPSDAGVCTYQGMQNSLNKHYEQMARTLSTLLAPVGLAWNSVIENHPEIQMYQADDKHPSVAGTYLAACVFYNTIFQKSPVGASSLTLDKGEANILQTAAQKTAAQ